MNKSPVVTDQDQPPARRPWLRVARVLPALVLAPGSLAGAYLAVQTDEDDALDRQHPFDVGTTWVYAVTEGGDTSGLHTRTVVGETRLGEDQAIGVRNAYTDNPFSGGATTETAYLGRGPDAVVQYGVRGSDGFSQLTPPAPAYAAHPTTSTNLDYEGTFGDLGLVSKVRVSEIADVEVSGRTFEGCAHYVTGFELTPEDSDQAVEQEVDEWICPEFGTVRTRTRIPSLGKDTLEELVAFHGRREDWVADGAELPAPDATPGMPAAGATSSVDAARTNGVDVDPDPGLGERLAWSDSRQQLLDWSPVIGRGTQVIADHGGDVVATDAVTGEVRWRMRVPGPVVAPPTVVGDVVLLAPADKSILAVALTDGGVRWIRELDDQVSAAPTSIDDLVVVPTDDARVTGVSVADGSVAWRRDTAAPVRTDPATDGTRVVTAAEDGTVTALDGAGRQLWSTDLENDTEAGPVVDEGVVVLADDLGVLYGLDVADGTVEWQARPADYTTATMAASDGAAFVVEEGGYLEAYDLASGERAWRADVGEVEVAPLGLGDRVLTVTTGGRVEVRDTEQGGLVEHWDLPDTGAGRTTVSTAPTVLDDIVVIGGATSAPDRVYDLFAYAVHEADTTTAGVVLSAEQRLLAPDALADRAVLDSDLLLAVDEAGRLLRSTSSAPAETALEDDALYPGPATQDGLAVVQVGEEFRGFDAAASGADPLWTYDAGGSSAPGSTPTITGDTVYLPLQGTALAALERDGTLRWRRPLPGALGASAPVPVDDGDVVFGPGGLTRYDGATGRPEWTLPNSLVPRAPAFADGVVASALLYSTGGSALVCLDARTGRARWSVPDFGTDFSTAPVVGDGVVVAVDNQSVAHAYAVDNGSELWQLHLGAPPAGSPYLIGGLLYLSSQPSDENLYQRDYRVTAHDPRTGRLRAAYEPSSPGYSGVPTVAGTSDGRLLVPVSVGLTAAVEILEALS